MSPEKNRVFAGHVPVLHQGYLDVFDKHRSRDLQVFDESIVSRFDYLRKDIRFLDAERIVKALTGLGYFATSMSFERLQETLHDSNNDLLLIDDDVTRSLLTGMPDVSANISFTSPFLRWDRINVNSPTAVTPDRTVPVDESIVKQLYDAAEKSSDWWRHVGAAIFDGERVIESYNRGIPHEHINGVEGDPRISANRGDTIENSLFIHAEADLIAGLAREGISSQGKELYVTTFPCPNCAKLIAASGIRSCYFVEGYAMLDGERVLKDAGVEIIQIDTIAPATNSDRLRTYPEKTANG